jgi:hypothetical protein
MVSQLPDMVSVICLSSKGRAAALNGTYRPPRCDHDRAAGSRVAQRLHIRQARRSTSGRCRGRFPRCGRFTCRSNGRAVGSGCRAGYHAINGGSSLLVMGLDGCGGRRHDGGCRGLRRRGARRRRLREGAARYQGDGHCRCENAFDHIELSWMRVRPEIARRVAIITEVVGLAAASESTQSLSTPYLCQPLFELRSE